MKITRFIPLVLSFVLLACQAASTISPQELPTAAVTILAPTRMPVNTVLPTPTRSMEQALESYTIDGLREHEYRSGDIHIRETLLETKVFTRYLIEYPSDGIVITGILQVPTVGEPPYPVIVMNHGFFSRTVYVSGDGTDRAAEFLNRRGYLTISSDYRTWGDSDTAESLYYSGLAIDVINLLNAIPSFPEADANRIGMWGHSMGGGVTLKVLTIDPFVEPGESPRIKAAVLYSSVSADFADIIERWGPGCLGDVFAGELEFGCNSSDVLPDDLAPDLIAAYFDSVDDPDLLKAVSPISYLDSVMAPVHIVYGTEDGQTSAGTPPLWSKEMYAAFDAAGKDVRLFAHDGEGHSFTVNQWFAFMERSSQFFDAYVKEAGR